MSIWVTGGPLSHAPVPVVTVTALKLLPSAVDIVQSVVTKIFVAYSEEGDCVKLVPYPSNCNATPLFAVTWSSFS